MCPIFKGQVCCPETSVTNYQSTLRNTPEERRFHLTCDGNLKSSKTARITEGQRNGVRGNAFRHLSRR